METDKVNFKNMKKIFIFLKFKYPAKKVATKKPKRYPMVGPVKYIRPIPFSGELEKTGSPIIPSNR